MHHQPRQAQLLTLGQAATRLGGVSYRTVRRWVARGELRAINTGTNGRGPSWRITETELDRFQRERGTHT